MSRVHAIRDVRTVGAYLNDAGFHLKLAEQALEQIEPEFSGYARSAVQFQLGQVRRVRRRVFGVLDELGVAHRSGTSGLRRETK